ncbi:hypothetical protein G7Y89_g11923 [Cudoniella acicularis]|uniref:Uncharacterized protein n=1 Tax=Cudoniella acicularis TaxID=354080 RepID=A0A8H4RC82_9HELO|nr:hypothetical protein G7Y89_g11923 [Cudoniella acicularis]
MTGIVFVAGFGDGAIRVFDSRNRPQEAMVRKWKDDTDRVWIKSVHMQRDGQRELVSASRNGKVRLWDIRMDKPLRTFNTTKDTQYLNVDSLCGRLREYRPQLSTHELYLRRIL